jgi:hypothetical protein
MSQTAIDDRLQSLTGKVERQKESTLYRLNLTRMQPFSFNEPSIKVFQVH